MPYYPPSSSASDVMNAQNLAFHGATPVPQPTGYNVVAPNLPTAKVIGAYASNAQSVAYTPGILNLLAGAQATDLNALRAAYENLRVFSENLAQQHMQLVTDLKALGLIGS